MVKQPEDPKDIDEREKERERRDRQARQDALREARTVALDLAVRCLASGAIPVPLADVLNLADGFLTYIVDGTPVPTPPTP